MYKNIKIIFSNRLNNKIIAVGCALICWHIGHQIYQDVSWIDAPLYVYHHEALPDIAYPESIKVCIQTDRLHLYMQTDIECTVHVDGTTINNESKIVVLKKENIIIPPTLKMIDYYPKIITLKKI